MPDSSCPGRIGLLSMRVRVDSAPHIVSPIVGAGIEDDMQATPIVLPDRFVGGAMNNPTWCVQSGSYTMMALISIALTIAGCYSDDNESIITNIRQVVVFSYPGDSLNPRYSYTELASVRKHPTSVYFVVDSDEDLLASVLLDTLDRYACAYLSDKRIDMYENFALIFLQKTDYSERLDTIRRGVSDASNPMMVKERYIAYVWSNGRFYYKDIGRKEHDYTPPSCWKGEVVPIRIFSPDSEEVINFDESVEIFEKK